jgi:hypothetical protein
MLSENQNDRIRWELPKIQTGSCFEQVLYQTAERLTLGGGRKVSWPAHVLGLVPRIVQAISRQFRHPRGGGEASFFFAA